MMKKEKFMHWIGALFYERKNKEWTISIGRVSWWGAFIPALHIWITCGIEDIAPNHIAVLLLLAGYNFGKHGLEIFKKKEEIEGPG